MSVYQNTVHFKMIGMDPFELKTIIPADDILDATQIALNIMTDWFYGENPATESIRIAFREEGAGIVESFEIKMLGVPK